MKNYFLSIVLLFTVFNLIGQTSNYDRHWKKVENFELKDLPKSALAEVYTIYNKAKKTHNNNQIIKSLIYKSKFYLDLEENAQSKIISEFNNEIKISTFPVKNILESILADLYWQYFQQNRYKFYNRTKTNQKIDSLDFRTWDLQTLFEETHQHYQNSLNNKINIQKLPISNYNPILFSQADSKKYRPTLFDFLAHRALDFYKTNERNILNPTYIFKIENSDLLKNNTIFLLTELATKDSLSQQLNAIYLYKELTQFHLNDKDPTALINETIERLNFIKNDAIFNRKEELFISSLLDLHNKYKSHPASAEVSLQIAYLYNNQANRYNPNENNTHQFKRLEAIKICNNVIHDFPKTKAAEKCKLLLETIKNKSLSITIEKYIPTNKPSRLYVKYKNISKLNFRLYKVDVSQKNIFNTIKSDSSIIAFLQSLKVEKQWSSNLKTENDFQEHAIEILFPDMQQGNYLVVAYHSNSLNKNELYSYGSTQITNISLINTNSPNKNVFQVIDRTTGKPLQNAIVKVKSYEDYTNRNIILNLTLHSDKNGFIKFKANKYYQNTQFTISYNNDYAYFGEYFLYKQNYSDKNKEIDLVAKPFLFTDRSIYRPGQTVYFKGILIQTEDNKSQVVANQDVVATLYDVNYEKIKELELKTNEFGSFNGTFILPNTGLTGDFTIEIDEGNKDSNFYNKITEFIISETSISVEEYKRPKFEIKFKPVKDSFRVNDSVLVNGEAISFSGANITNAKVKYRVVRTSSYPYIYRYSFYPNRSKPQEICHGKTFTNSSGVFELKFKAIPDLVSNKELQPVFNYKVYVDVTDINGETHSTETKIRIGYHSLEISISMPSLIDKSLDNNKIIVHTKNLNGVFTPNKGHLKIYKLLSPNQISRNRPWNKPDYYQFTKQEFEKLFPHDVYKNEKDEKTWKKGSLVFENEINTNITKVIVLNNIKKWQSGKYIAVIECSDKFEKKITNENRFTVYNSKDNDVISNKLLLVTSNQLSYKTGEKASIKFSSAAKDIFVTVFIEKNHEIVERRIIHLSNETKTINISINKDDIGGFAVYYHTAFFNSFDNGKILINVPYPKKDLHITTNTFRDKIQPGSKQLWSFTINGNKKDKVIAEVLASMYDASLDQFKTHYWNFTPIVNPSYYSYNKSSANYSFGVSNLNNRNLEYKYFRLDINHYDKLNWFGFSLSNNKWLKKRYLQNIITKYTKPNISAKNDKNKEKGFVYGKVSDETDVLPGVSITIKGTTIGTTTDFDGNFILKAKKGDILVFKYIGMTTLEFSVGKNNSYKIKMIQNNESLDEVVVTAMGIAKDKRAIGYSQSIIDDNEIIETIEEDTAEIIAFALAGKVAGVEVSEVPGAAKKIFIRGSSSLKNSNQALIIIDGVPYSGDKEYEIDKDNLLSIVVLKGDEATTLYGSKGENGVILITTISGQKKINNEFTKVKARTNFKETAFFFPNLSTDKNGNISFNFTMPEALTRWKLQLLAHTKNLETGYKQISTLSQKDLMVIPNTPRFLRENDTILIQTKITNLSKNELNGTAQLKFTNALNGKDISRKLLFYLNKQNKNFTVKPNNSASVSWKIVIPKNIQAIQYKIVAKASNFSDGEQNILPVLSNRMLVTETMTMLVKSNEKRVFNLDKLKNNTSNTLSNHKLTLEITSNPVWYAIQALPYLMEFPYECSEQTFSRYYANTLASYLIHSNPKIEKVFKQWASSDALISNLEKNQELKSIVIQETPWLRDAHSEAEQKKQIALLFDLNKMKNEQGKALNKLMQMQNSNGGFPWFSGGRFVNRNITQHIAIGFGKLNKIINKSDVIEPNNHRDFIKKILSYLDNEILNDYNYLLIQAKDKKEGKESIPKYLDQNHTGSFQIQYLYMRSFFKDFSISKKSDEVLKYYKKQSLKYWTDFDLYSRGLIVLIAKENSNNKIVNDIYKSLQENSITSEKMGMYWKENKPSWNWYQSPIQTQTLMIEVFNQLGANDSTIYNLKLWLLKNKQTKNWKTTKATTNAIYALLATGTNWVDEKEFVKVTVGNKLIEPNKIENTKIEAGTGYFKTSWNGNKITPSMATISLEKKSKGVAFGGLYWQYFEDLDKITSAKTALKVSKKLFIKKNTNKGEELTLINKGSLIQVGDIVTVRIEIKVDRDMEFVHLKDMRASGFEPTSTLSEYKYQDNLYYYQSTKDASTNFFIDYLPKGVFVFEYDLRANNKGNFSNGITTLQSMYAPEFSSHSKGVRVQID